VPGRSASRADLQSDLERLPSQVRDQAMACSEPSLWLMGLMMDLQSTVLQIWSLPEEILNSKFFRVTRAMQVFSDPLIKESWNVVGRLSGRRCLPVRVGRSSPAGHSTGLASGVFFLDAVRVVACRSGPADEVGTEGITAHGVRTAVGIELGDAELGIVNPAVEGDGFACTAEPILAPPMINSTATASTIVAPRISPRRAQ